MFNNLQDTIGAFARQLPGMASTAYNFATQPLTSPQVAPIQKQAQNTPIMPWIRQLTPKAMMGANVPGANLQVPSAVSAGFPITQVPGMVQGGIRQMGRYAGLQPSPIDLAMLPLYTQALKANTTTNPETDRLRQQLDQEETLPMITGNTYDEMSGQAEAANPNAPVDFTPTTEEGQVRVFNAMKKIATGQTPEGQMVQASPGTSTTLVNARPPHQVAIENALNAGDTQTAQAIIDGIPQGDPYKESMQKLVDRLKGQKGNINLLTPQATGEPNYMPNVQMTNEPTSMPEVIRAFLGTLGFGAAPFVGAKAGKKIGSFVNKLGGK